MTNTDLDMKQIENLLSSIQQAKSKQTIIKLFNELSKIVISPIINDDINTFITRNLKIDELKLAASNIQKSIKNLKYKSLRIRSKNCSFTIKVPYIGIESLKSIVYIENYIKLLMIKTTNMLQEEIQRKMYHPMDYLENKVNICDCVSYLSMYKKVVFEDFIHLTKTAKSFYPQEFLGESLNDIELLEFYSSESEFKCIHREYLAYKFRNNDTLYTNYINKYLNTEIPLNTYKNDDECINFIRYLTYGYKGLSDYFQYNNFSIENQEKLPFSEKEKMEKTINEYREKINEFQKKEYDEQYHRNTTFITNSKAQSIAIEKVDNISGDFINRIDLSKTGLLLYKYDVKLNFYNEYIYYYYDEKTLNHTILTQNGEEYHSMYVDYSCLFYIIDRFDEILNGKFKFPKFEVFDTEKTKQLLTIVTIFNSIEKI